MSDITPFNFEGSTVRCIYVEGEPWFVGVDVCNVLKIDDPRKSIGRLESDDRNFAPVIDSMGRSQRTLVINESGLYELIIRSNKPDARGFRRWVTTEVLPQIRKTGSYQLVPVDPDDDLDLMERTLARLREDRKRIRALETGQKDLAAKVSAVAGEYDEFTTLAYARRRGLPTDRVSCQKHGQRASRLLRLGGQEPRKVQDATFGWINVYPVDILDETAEI